MKSTMWLATAVLAVVGVGIVQASGPIAVYGLVDTVTFEPNADKPRLIRISGLFSVAEQGSNNKYLPPERGYLYLSLPDMNTLMALREWTDLKAIAGTRQVVGFGSNWSAKVRVRKSSEEAKSPDEYPLGNGLVKVNNDHPQAKTLLDHKEH